MDCFSVFGKGVGGFGGRKEMIKERRAREEKTHGKSTSRPKQSSRSFLLGDSAAMDDLCVVRDCV